ncbi:MAG: hypothetical protein CM15mP74_33760 [Halieaceae bacterium]|nr:MAG: hypothetical protein CM15mP74_33760 [Halieaceae bacterium]
MPGHHLQISFQQENQSLPQWRREYYFHAYGEGWGLYSEWLGQEMGVYTTPYERFGRLIYEVWRAVRWWWIPACMPRAGPGRKPSIT